MIVLASCCTVCFLQLELKCFSKLDGNIGGDKAIGETGLWVFDWYRLRNAAEVQILPEHISESATMDWVRKKVCARLT